MHICKTYIVHPHICSLHLTLGVGTIGQLPVVVILLAGNRPNNFEKVMPRDIRYMINATYAAVKAATTEVNNNPLTSEEKNSTRRYPLMTITKAATSHDTVCQKENRNGNNANPLSHFYNCKIKSDFTSLSLKSVDDKNK